MEFDKIEDILTYILNVYVSANPYKDGIMSMDIYNELNKIAKAMDIRASFVKVIL